MSIFRSLGVLVWLALASHPFSFAQTSPVPATRPAGAFASDATFSVAPATGALTWTLPVGVAPGDLPIPVTFRFQPSRDARGIWGGLHFGYLTPPEDEAEGVQVLEDGQSFQDRDWTRPAADGSGLPQAFGFQAPRGGYAVEPSRAFGLFVAGLEDLGRWRSRVAASGMTRFKVLMDRDRARVFGFNDALNVFVPVLWVDRFGHSVTFRWEHGAGGALAVRVTNDRGKGVEAAWDGAVGLLQADFIGVPSPSLRVRGLAGRPAEVRLDTASVPDRVWTFRYTGNGPGELSMVQDPMGVTTSFAYEPWRIPAGEALRGVTGALSVDAATGITRAQTWSRTSPAALGEPWTVSHTETWSPGDPTEGRTTISTFVDAGAGPERAFLRSVRTQGAAGTLRTLTYDSVPGAPAGTVSTRLRATGKPGLDILLAADPATGNEMRERVEVEGREVQTRDFAYDGPFPDLGNAPPQQ